MRLDVGEIGAEQRLRPLDRQTFRDVDELATPVIAAPRVAFGVLVGQHRALCSQHAGTRKIFRADQFDVFFLAAAFALQRLGEFLIEALNRFGFIEHDQRPSRAHWREACAFYSSSRADPGSANPSTTRVHARARLSRL